MTYEMAERLEDEEKYEEAFIEYKKLYENKPGLELLQRLGHLATMLGKYEEAEKFYSKTLDYDATSEVAHEQLMDLYINTNKYKYYICRGNLHSIQHKLSHAINDFKKALNHAETPEEVATTRFVLANLYEQTDKLNSAIDEYLRILDHEGANEAVFMKLASVYEKQDALSSAIEILERARNNGFDTDNINEMLAQIYLKTQNPELAVSLTKDLLVKARSLMDDDKLDEAFELLKSIEKDYKKNATFNSLLAQYYYQTGDWEKALEYVNEFDKFEKNSPLTYQMRALIFEEQDDDFNAHLNWAKYNILRKDKDVALNEYLMAYQINENDTSLVLTIAETLEELGDKTQAAEFYERLASLDSTNKKALEKLFEFREHIGDYRSAREYIEKLYELDSKNVRTIKNLATIYEKLRLKDKAVEFYTKFINASHDAQEIETITKKISKLEGSKMQAEEGLLDKIMRLFNK